MALDFPTGDDFPLEGNKIPDGYKFEGYYWDESLGAWKRQCDESGSGTVFYQDVPPEDNADNDLQEGNLWINSNNLLLHVWTGDEWIEVGAACGSGGAGGGGADLPFQGLITTRDVKTIDRGDGNNPFELVQDLSDNVASKDATTQDPIDDLLQTQEDINDFLAQVAERTLFGLQRTADNVGLIENTISFGGFVRKQKAVSAPAAGTCYMLLDGGAEATDYAGLQNLLIAKDGLGPYASFEDAKRGDIVLIQSDDDIAYGQYIIQNVTELALGWDFGLRLARERGVGDTPEIDESCKIRISRPVPTVAQEIEPIFSESGQLWYDTANDRLKVWDQEDGQFYDVGGENAGPKPDITGRERVYLSAGQDPYGVQEGEISAGLVSDTNLSFHLRPPDENFFILGETYIINGIETTLTTVEHRDDTHALGHAHTYFKTADGINIGPKGTPVSIVGPEEYLRLTGGTLTGTLTIENIGNDALDIKNKAGGSILKAHTGNYSEDVTYGKLAADYGSSKFEIANRFYLEDTYLPLSGGKLTGSISLPPGGSVGGRNADGLVYNNLLFDGGKVTYVGFKTQDECLATQGDLKDFVTQDDIDALPTATPFVSVFGKARRVTSSMGATTGDIMFTGPNGQQPSRWNDIEKVKIWFDDLDDYSPYNSSNLSPDAAIRIMLADTGQTVLLVQISGTSISGSTEMEWRLLGKNYIEMMTSVASGVEVAYELVNVFREA